MQECRKQNAECRMADDGGWVSYVELVCINIYYHMNTVSPPIRHETALFTLILRLASISKKSLDFYESVVFHSVIAASSRHLHPSRSVILWKRKSTLLLHRTDPCKHDSSPTIHLVGITGLVGEDYISRVPSTFFQ